MKSVFSYFITFIAVIYWVFRVAVCLMFSMKQDFICQPFDSTLEIIILFLTIPAILLIIRRNVIGTTLYFGMYAAYFGTVLYHDFMATGGNLSVTETTSMFLTALGVVIPLLVLADVLLQKSGYAPENKNTDWYYENEKYDRQYDERADRNQYKIK